MAGFAGGRADKCAMLGRLLNGRSADRWLLIGDDGGHDPQVFADVFGRAPGRVAAVGMRRTHAPDERPTDAREPVHVHGVPVAYGPNGAELLSRLRDVAGLGAPSATGPADWLLVAEERGNDATRLRAWTEGNDARPLVHGATYFPVLATALASAGASDLVLLGGWRCDGDQQLGPEGPTVTQAVGDAARRGALVRGLLWRSHPSALGYHLEPNLQTARALAPTGAQVLLDQRVRPLGCHHQKFIAVRFPQRPVDDVAFVGGIDLDRGARDDAAHAGDPQSDTASTYYGPTPARHDVHVELRGPAVREVDEVFRERWTDPAPLTRLPWQTLYDRIRRVPRTASPLPRPLPAPPPSGTCTVQVLRTYPARRSSLPFAPRGERSIARLRQSPRPRPTADLRQGPVQRSY
jgi:phosphatidylserine/phosphatidylglycerophosphate/cardiolipin synthase-like enzyme